MTLKKENEELKCKLEQMASGMGTEVHKKIKKETEPIYTIFKMLIIFGFLTVFLILGTYMTISINKTETIIKDRIIYVEVPCYIKDEKSDMPLIKTKIKGNRIWKYYRDTSNNKKWKFYTTAEPLHD
jgi:hypothetical protein